MNNKNNGDNNNKNINESGADMGKNGKKQFFIDTIAKFCDKCGSEYSSKDVHIVQESNFSSIIHFSCPNCKSNHIATFIRPMGMSSRMPINSDLGVEEIAQFARKDKVTSDEVLEVYNMLENLDDKIQI